MRLVVVPWAVVVERVGFRSVPFRVFPASVPATTPAPPCCRRPGCASEEDVNEPEKEDRGNDPSKYVIHVALLSWFYFRANDHGRKP